jgi:CubicO group peptidase (beta-lactamase class C family)
MRRHKPVLAISLVLLVPLSGRSLSAGDGLPRAHPDQVGLDASVLSRADAPFQDAVQRKKIAGAVLLVARHGKVGYLEAVGMQDVEAGTAMSPGTIFRIASMTKPVTSTAIMLLADQGRLDLSDPLSRYIPEFRFMKVAVPKKRNDGTSLPADSAGPYDRVPAYRPITVRDLLMHTSGLSYRMMGRPILGRLYAEAGVCDGLSPCDHSLAENVRRLARLPLLHQPGTAWEYGLNTDVLGRLVEVVSDQSLDVFFTERIFKPLGMNDTHFVLPEAKRDRLAALYEPGPSGAIVRTGDGPTTKGGAIYAASFAYKGNTGYYSGGAGLVSTAGDYSRFLQMLLNRGELDGVRLLRPETVDAMTRDQTEGLSLWIGAHGPTFGYGFGIATKPSSDGKNDPVGTFSWGGIYYTDFWVDRKHELIGIMLTQIYPSDGLTLRDQFHHVVNQAIQASRESSDRPAGRPGG